MIITCIQYNWNAFSAISNIVLAIIAVATLAFSILLMVKQNKQRKDEIRARLMFSFYRWKDLYFLKVENIGKEPAYDVNLTVTGKPIEDNLYKKIVDVFSDLASKKFAIPPGKSKYFLISPAVEMGADLYFGNERHSYVEIKEWLDQYGDELIYIRGTFNNKYKIDESMSIKEHIVYDTFCVYEQYDWIAESLSDISGDIGKVQKHLKVISENIKKQNKANG